MQRVTYQIQSPKFRFPFRDRELSGDSQSELREVFRREFVYIAHGVCLDGLARAHHLAVSILALSGQFSSENSSLKSYFHHHMRGISDHSHGDSW